MPPGRLQQEIKKRRPFDSLEEEATLNLLRTSDRVQIQFTRLFRTHGLTHPQYNILRILRGEGEPLPCLEIASRLLAVVPGITGLIDRLEALGMVTRERSGQDRRVVRVGITPKALALLSEMDEPVRALHRKVMGHLAPAEQRTLVALLEKTRVPLEEDL